MAWKHSADQATKRDAMQEFADSIIAALESGVKPWVKPWDESKCGGPQAPTNPVTKHNYRGVNVLILSCSLLAFQTGDPRWCSFLQAKDRGWSVKKGSKATTIFFTKMFLLKDAKEGGEEPDDEGKTARMLRHYPVFHASQIEGIPPYVAPDIETAPWRRPEAADIILKNSGAVVCIGGDRAFYSPATDHIQLPPDSAFRDPAEWACVALHELGHFTGAPNRLNRDMSGKFGSANYSEEEIRVELASAFLAGELGIPADIPNHVSYIDHWLTKLKADKKFIFRAAADAQRICDFILGLHPGFVLSTQPTEHRPEPTSAAATLLRCDP